MIVQMSFRKGLLDFFFDSRFNSVEIKCSSGFLLSTARSLLTHFC